MLPKLEKIPSNCLIIKYELDREYLEKVAYTLPRKKFYYKGKEVWGYHYAPWNNDEVEKELKSTFNLRGRYNIKFIFLRPATNLDWHVDKGTKSAIIWKMSGDDPIHYRDKKYYYDPNSKSWIIDINDPNNAENERVWLENNIYNGHFRGEIKKISIFDRYK